MNDQSNYLITKILAEKINGSGGSPTIKVTVWVGDTSGSFSVPSGASTGVHEAHVIENNKAIFNVNETISKALVGKNVSNQKEIDKILIELDGTSKKDNLGGNSMIGVSIACAKIAAKISRKEVFEYLRTLMEIKPSRKVPYLFMNLLEGGKHAHNGFNLAFQEYHIVPETEEVREALDIGIKINNTLRETMQENDPVNMGDEGGFALRTSDIRMPLKYLNDAIKKNNLQNKVHLALDVAAASFYKNGLYKVDGKNISKEELMNIYNSLISEFNLFSIEDAFDEEDFESFAKLKKQNPNLLIVGDDLTVSNKEFLQKAIKCKSINAMIIKPNQIGTLTETLETMKLARENNIELIVSHRGEETNDDFIADLAYAFNCFGLKAGAPVKPERMVKYERLIKIINY
ncbi:MAG: phosphopyruvate hydratase [bacterium]